VAAEVFPIGSYVSLVNAADEIAHLFTEQADKIDADGSVPLTADWDVLDNKITAQNLTADALTAGRGVFTGTDGLLSVDGAFIWDNTNKRLGIGVTPLHIIHVSSSIDTGIGIGTTDAGREAYLALYSNSVSIGTFEAFGSTFAVADYQSAVSFTAQVNNDGKICFTTKTSGTPTARMVILNNGNVGIGTTAPGAKCHVDQSSTSGAIPVLTLDQADLSEEFISFKTTVGDGNPMDATNAVGSAYARLRIDVDGVGYKYIQVYDA